MDLLYTWIWCSISLALLLFFRGTSGAAFTFVNNCDYTVWPGILANSGTPNLESTGFELQKGSSRSFQAPTGWSGRFWGRTSCDFSGTNGACATGDCGSGGEVECNGSGATPPATLAEFTLGSGGSQDFYDVSLVDGYNLPMVVEPQLTSTSSGGGRATTSTCVPTGCVTDLNRLCPAELKAGGGQGCKSACEAFGSPEYCCSGAYNTPTTCKPSVYSAMFKSACPRSYSYAYDDATSTFTCMGADYIITFCPSYANSQKSSTGQTQPTTEPETQVANGAGSSGSSTDTGSGSGSGSSSSSDPQQQVGGGGGGGAMLTDASWIAGLATGQSSCIQCCALFIATTAIAILALNTL